MDFEANDLIEEEEMESDEPMVNGDFLALNSGIVVGQMRLRVKQTNNSNKIETSEANTVAFKMKELLSEFCELNCPTCHELISKLSQHVNSDHQASDVEENADDLDFTPEYLDEENIKIEYDLFPPDPEPEPEPDPEPPQPPPETAKGESELKKPKEFQCTKCSAGFFKMKNMKQHYRTVHEPTKPNLHCTACDSVFGTTRNLSRHFKKAHPTLKLSYPCSICNLEFQMISWLTRHVAKDHRSKEKPKPKPKPLKCPHPNCMKRFILKFNLDQHIQNSHPPGGLQCPTCGKSCENKRLFLQHKTTHSQTTTNGQFMCETCGKTFNKRQRLTRHKRIHSGVKPYRCDLCGKSFLLSNALKAHYKTKMHAQERPHKCEVCGKGFLLHESLKRHMISHTESVVKIEPGSLVPNE